MDLHLWSEAVQRYLAPDLPGYWQFADDNMMLIAGEIDWMLRFVAVQPSDHGPWFYLNWGIQPLPVPKGYCGSSSIGNRVGQVSRGGSWDEPVDLAGYEPVMAEIARCISAEVVPEFDRYGTVDGYIRHVRKHMNRLADRGREWIDPHADEELVYLSLLLNDLATAERAAEFARRAAADEIETHPDPAQWVLDVHARVEHVMHVARTDNNEAVRILQENARFTAKSIRIPPPCFGMAPAADHRESLNDPR
ncbi:hypothetical protein [Nocardia carnea]|uniref:hypothetical protein n=1 Tax=Nocardia carnea TaxID=37328 RepID=UPI002453F224|nr:hypothetical protein [Nocardia carnea]